MFAKNRGSALWVSALWAMNLAGCSAGGLSFPASSFSLSAPSKASFLIADADFEREPRVVDAAGALADLDAAQRIFDEAYAGVDGQPRLPAPAQIVAARRMLAASASWAPAALAEELRALFGRPDGHLVFGYGGPSPLRLTTVPPQNRLGERDLIACRAEQESPLDFFLRPARFEPAQPSSTAISVTFGDVPVLAIRTFDSAAQGALRALPEIATRLRHAPAFVVDVRGNGGGNYTFAEAFILALTDRTLKRLDEREVRSVAAAEGRANSARRRIAAGEVPAEAMAAFAAHIASLEAEAVALRAASSPRAEVVTRGATVRGHAEGPLKGRAVFLTDHGCASACEMMLTLARQIPGVIIAGENTHGSMAVGEVALFRLPSSGVTISLGTRAFHDPLDDFAEVRGFLPDVWFDGSDPLADARRLALEGPASPSALRARRRPKSPDPALEGPRAALR
jgi:hypothetical protein